MTADLSRGPAASQLVLSHAAVEAAANAIVIADRAGIIEYVNPAFTRMTGYAQDEAVGQHTRLLKSGHHDAAFYEVLWRTVLNGAVWNGTLINRKKDGTLYTEEATITPVSIAGGPLTHFIAIKRDVTVQRRLEEIASRSERLGLIGELASSVAHDLANVLTPVVSGVAYLQSDEGSSEERAECLTEVAESATHAAAMVRQLVDFARGGHGLRAPIDTSRLLRSYVEQLKRTAVAGVTIEGHVPDDLPALHADGLQLYQVLLNLCVNASDAMPGGGTISIEAAAVAHPEASFVELSVKDSGQGIPDAVLPRIFEAFFTTKPVGKGTGLGLATVKRIAEAHGGTVRVQTTGGVGSTFTVALRVGEA